MVCMVDAKIITAGQMYRYYTRETVVGDGRRRRRTPLRQAQEEAGVPVGRWMGLGLGALGLVAGEEVTEEQLRNLFGEEADTRTRSGSWTNGLPWVTPRRWRGGPGRWGGG